MSANLLGNGRFYTTMTRHRLLMFLKYPLAGQTKTRLIPALGPEKAAQLQREMAEHLLRQLTYPEWQLDVYFTGSHLTDMQAWLGHHQAYYLQSSGNLGERLCNGFRQTFQFPCLAQRSRQSVVAIGADCPEVGVQHIQQAFKELKTHDVVIGPAQDGGYYLIGVRSHTPRLFQNIAWSTPQVFRQTYQTANELGLSIACLETLSDIDRPEDLAIWHQIKQSSLSPQPHVV